MNIFDNIKNAFKNENKKHNYRYVIVNSEIGPIHCYELGGNFTEFFTEGKCHRKGNYIVFDSFNIGFISSKHPITGDGEFDIRYISKEEFANSLDHFIRQMGSIEVAEYYIESKIKEKIVEKEKYLEENKNELEDKLRREREYKLHTQEIIKKYNIK